MAPTNDPPARLHVHSHVGPHAEDSPLPGPSDSLTSRAQSELESIRSGFTKKTERPKAAKWSSGSWRGKAPAVAELAHDSASAGESSSRPHLTPSLSQGLRRPLKSMPSYASLARVNITTGKGSEEATIEPAIVLPHETPDDKEVSEEAIKGANADHALNRPSPGPGWRGWWTKSKELESETRTQDASPAIATTQPSDATMPSHVDVSQALGSIEEASAENNNSIPIIVASDGYMEPVGTEVTDNSSAAISTTDQATKSWFGMWPAVPSTVTGSDTIEDTALPPEHTSTEVSTASASGGVNIPSVDKPHGDQAISASQNSGGWAFWSRERPKVEMPEPITDNTQEVFGELSVEGTASQSKTESERVKANPELEKPASNIAKPRQKQRPVSLGGAAVALLKGRLSDEREAGETPNVVSSTAVEEAASQAVEVASPDTPSKDQVKPSVTTNLLLPLFSNTYREDERPSYYEQLLRMLGQSVVPKPRHLFLAPVPTRIENALAIGVHGFFPNQLIQKVLGQPTGTSIRFANGAAAAIREYTQQHGYSCEVEQVALEGEGMIADRVDALWKLLLNWLEQIRKADFILVACHSQGVPVAVMLVAKLLELNCISPSVRIGICAMAGVNLGPFSSYQSRYFGGSAAELFDFARPDSAVSKAYQSALTTTLAHHVRLVYIGSIDDQLVSLESSTFACVSHPYIFRAVFVDGRLHAPDFITHLVGFALKLRNLGVPDHGLIRELSGPLAGSLYGGEGHSRIYEDPAVYALAVQHALETASLDVHVPMATHAYEVPSPANSNPYFLPWAMRGVLEEEYVKRELQGETSFLLDQFDGWRPSSKVLKDVKFRLDAVKSKLGK